MNVKRVRMLTGLLLVQGCLAWIVCANPSHKVLDAALAIHGKTSVAPWHAEAAALYEKSRTKLLAYLEKEKNNAIKTISAEDLGKTHLMLNMMTRGGAWLHIWGEPSGIDFELRRTAMGGHLGRVLESSKAYPATQKYIENFRQFIAKTGVSRANALTNIEKLCNERKWQVAEGKLFNVYDTLAPGTVFLSQDENRAIYLPFAQVDTAIQKAMQEMRSDAAEQELTQQIAEVTTKYPPIQQEIQAAVESVVATGSASWRGEPATGPQLIEKIAQVWREVQVAAHQCRAKQWALASRDRYGDRFQATDPTGDPASDGVSGPFLAFSDVVRQAVIRLVEGEANRVPTESVRALYIDYLRALAPVLRQTNDLQWRGQLDAAVRKLAAKDSTLTQDIQNYDAATAEILRWRARLAAAQTAAKNTEYAPIEATFHAAAVCGKVNDVDYIGLFQAPPSQDPYPQLLTDAPEIMPIAIQRLSGQKSTVRDIVRIAATSKTAIARYTARTYAMLPAPLDVTREVTALKSDLMASDQHPPLTLAAMQGVVTAERGDLVAAGGEITGAHLESVITRFATLPASAAVICELGRMPAETFSGSPLTNMLMRFELTPHWVSHEYFFSLLTPSPGQTAGR